MRSMLVAACAATLSLLPACASDDPPDLEDSPVLSTEKGPDFEADAELYRHNAQAYYQAGDYFRALDQLRKAIKKDPGSKAARVGEALCLYNLGFNAAALGNTKDAATRLRAAEEKAEALIDEPLPRSTVEGDGLAWKSHLVLAMTQRALARLDRMVINGIDAQLAGASASERERMLEERKKRGIHEQELEEKALAGFRRLAAMEFAAPDAILNLADMELAGGNRRAAIEQYGRYLEIARRNIDNWNRSRKEWTEQLQSEKYQLEAQREIDAKLESVVGKAVDVLKRLAHVEFVEGAHQDSLAHLLEAARLDPSRNDLNVPIAENHLRLGSHEEALAHIDAYIAGTSAFDDNVRRAYRLRSEILKELGR